MKQEAKDLTIVAASQAYAWVGYITSGGQAVIVVLTILLLLVQLGYYLWRWWRDFTRAGISMRRLAAKHGLSKPVPLDD